MKTLTNQFIEEISKIKEPEVFLGVARLLHVKLLQDEFDENKRPVARDFTEICADVIQTYDKEERRRKRELLRILHKANKEVKVNANSTKNSEAESHN